MLATAGRDQGLRSAARTRDVSAGLYVVSYITTVAGLYDLGIQLAGKHVPGSPFQVTIMYDKITTKTT